jgi:8-oxo-dGTP pyrophosphatase MutT (NUDIX family)
MSDQWPDSPRTGPNAPVDTGSPGKHKQRVAVYGICEKSSNDGTSVLLVRAAPYLTVAGHWFLPGGGIDHGEEPVAALRRECEEETGLHVEVGDFLGLLSDVIVLPDGTSLHTVRIIYAIDSFAGDLHDETDGSTDHAQWIGTSQALQLPLMPYVRRALVELRREIPH